MGCNIFQRCLVLTLSALCLFVSSTWGLHADEAGVIDWHHKLIGTPLEGSTFLHKPVVGSGALAFTLTDKNILAALSLRDGAISTKPPPLTRYLNRNRC
jgi:ER membrane protein complex subunit 1